MYIEYLNLINFRNYASLSLKFSPSVNIFIGDNAQGKTNILESIFYCSFARSHRTNKDKELIKWGAENSFIQAYVRKERLDKKIDIKIFKQGKKGININSIKISKIADLVGTFNVVMFSPEDLKIVKESPSYRRKFLDMELSQLNRRYYYNLVQYNKILSERNFILKKWDTDPNILDVYDAQLSQFGALIIKERVEYLSKLNKKGSIIHKDITSGLENINFKYLTSVKDIENAEQELLNLFFSNRKKDAEKRMTSIGPHRDDFSININGVDTKSFGSQGQQRTAVLTIKFSSLQIIKDETGEYPVLLLDDVLSELDINRQKYLLKSIDSIQTIITCTGINDVVTYLSKNAKVFYVGNEAVEEGVVK